MLKNNDFVWSDETKVAFEVLKKAIITTSILAMPNFKKMFKVYLDASNVEVGAVLTQEEMPLTYISKAFSV